MLNMTGLAVLVVGCFDSASLNMTELAVLVVRCFDSAQHDR